MAGKATLDMDQWIDTDAAPSATNAGSFYNPACYWAIFTAINVTAATTEYFSVVIDAKIQVKGNKK